MLARHTLEQFHEVFVSADFDRPLNADASAQLSQSVMNANGKRVRGARDAPVEPASHFSKHPGDQRSWLGEISSNREMLYAPAYFVGSFTVSRLRPFFRRRLSTSLPHLSDIRVRNPWVFIRRLFRGLYVGLPINSYLEFREFRSFEDKSLKLTGTRRYIKPSSMTAGAGRPI